MEWKRYMSIRNATTIPSILVERYPMTVQPVHELVQLMLTRQAQLQNVIHSYKKEMAELREDIADIKKMLEPSRVGNDITDNYDMTVEQIRDMILEKYDLLKPVYPSDIADDNGLDYDAVIEAIEMLRRDGRVKYEGE